jgi:hypothetical protein
MTGIARCCARNASGHAAGQSDELAPLHASAPRMEAASIQQRRSV